MLAKRRLLPFVQRLNPRYDAGWVHKDICRRLEKFSDDVAKGLSPRLMILMPPRHGKSELASRMFPAWHLGRHNDHEVIACAYNVSLAMSFSRKVKEAMDDPAYQSVFEARLNPDFRSNEEWGLLGKRGGYVAAGVGGGITGKGAHCVVGDTPVDTPSGQTAIQDLKVGDVVLAFNHDRCKIEPTTVQATRRLVKNDIYTIETASGKRVRVTGNHPVYVSGVGYLPAEQLTVGMPLLSLARGDSGGAVRALQNISNHPTRVFAREAAQREQELELFPGVYYTAPSNPQELPDMFGGLHRPEQVLLASVQARVSGAGHVQEARGAHRAGAQALPPVRDGVPAQIAPDSVLWAGLRSGGPLREDARGCEPELFGGQASALGELQAEDSAGNGQRTRSEVCRMRGDVEAVCAPQGRGQDERRPVQFGSGVPHMSFGPSQICEDPISSIELDRSKYEVVYDIQTSLSNFLILTLVAHNCLIIDDPVKNAEEADSADVREKLWDWYGSTAYTRLAPGGGVLVIQTHWHDDDLAGRLQTAMSTDDEADQFELVKYPAIAEHDEYLDDDTDLIVYSEPPERGKLIRLKGEPLHPERYDLVKLNRIKKTIPTRFWAALYQQNPVPDDGAYFTKDMFRRAALPPLARSNVFIAFDFAISEKKANDYTVGVVGLQDEDDVLHFADMVRFKSGDGMFIVEAILNLCQKWYTPNLVLGFEDGQIFRAIESLLKKRMRERKFYPSTMLLKPITDKQARARPLQGRMQQGMVSFCSQGDWVDGARTEMLRFPAGVHDDQVDAIAWAATMAIGREPPRKPRSQEPESWRKKLASLGGSGASYMTA